MSNPSTYMGFPISSIGTDSGLNWETNLNAALTVIDQHNHSPGSGQQIQPNGLNINSDLSFISNNATNLRAVRFTPQASPIANTGVDVGEIYVSGNELYYNDVTGGNQVKLTSNGSVNATSSGISSGTASAAFSAGTLIVKSSGTSYGNVAMQSAILANSGNLTNQLTLQAPTLTSSITETLPQIPVSQSFMTIDTSGNMTGYAPISQGIQRTNIVAVGQQISSSSGQFQTGNTTYTQVTNLSVTITTTGRPVMLMVQSDGSSLASSSVGVINSSTSGATPTVIAEFAMFRGATAINDCSISTAGFSSSGSSIILRNLVSPGTLNFLDTPTAGTYTYTLKAMNATPGEVNTVAEVNNCVLVAYEL